MVTRRVRGSLFLDYVRMIRSRPDVDWSKLLAPEDLPYLEGRIDLEGWYPMETFERFGIAILQEIAGGQMEAVRSWGRFQVDALRNLYPTLVAEGDPQLTMMRFRVLRSGFFDFDAVEITSISDGEAWVHFQYHMSELAEQAASYQAMGFFERLLEVAGAQAIGARFHDQAWMGAPQSRLHLSWRAPGV